MAKKEPILREIDCIGDFVDIIYAAISHPLKYRIIDHQKYDLDPANLKTYSLEDLNRMFEKGVSFWYTPE